MRIAFEADDENATTAAVLARLIEAGHDVVRPAAQAQAGPEPTAAQWPEVGTSVGLAVANGAADLGVVMCWTGTGVSIAANKIPGVRAALAWEPYIATGARRWNDANVLAMSLARLAPAVAVEVLDAFLAVPGPDPDEKNAIDSVIALDR
jgi:ribose 5-phosphate isomerase B